MENFISDRSGGKDMKFRSIMSIWAMTATVFICFPVLLQATEETEQLTQTQQIQRIVGGLEKWKPVSGGSYAVTDLDGNGLFEIISCSDKDDVIQDIIYEIGEDGKLAQVETAWPDDENQPMLISDETSVWYDEQNGIYYYILGSDRGEGDMEKGSLQAVWLQDGVLTSEELGSFDASGKDTLFYNAEGNEISGNEYEKLAEEKYGDLRAEKARIRWVNTNEHKLSSDVPMEQIMELLSESASGFSLEEK